MSTEQSVTPARAGAARGAHWIGDGWQVFCANPGMWLVLTLIWLLINLALQLLPFVGFLVVVFIAPALAGGLLTCARDSLAGEALDVGQLFDPITDARRRDPVLVQGALFLLANLTVLAITGGLMMGTIGSAMLEHHAEMLQRGHMEPGALDPAAMIDMAMPVMFAALAALALQVVLWALFFYAVPLVVFNGVGQGAALGASLRGVLRNWLALLVFGVLWLLLAIAASIPLFLGWLVLLPMTFGAWLGSYRDIFGHLSGDDAATDDAQPARQPAPP